MDCRLEELGELYRDERNILKKDISDGEKKQREMESELKRLKGVKRRKNMEQEALEQQVKLVTTAALVQFKNSYFIILCWFNDSIGISQFFGFFEY